MLTIEKNHFLATRLQTIPKNFILLLVIFTPLSFASVISSNLKNIPNDYLSPVFELHGLKGTYSQNLLDTLELDKSSELGEIIAKAEQYVESHPDSDEAYEMLGIVYFQAQDYLSAVKSFDIAIDKNGKRSELYTKKGIALMELDQLEKAETSFLTALKMNDRDRYAHQRLGMIYEYQHKNNLAIQHYFWGLQYSPPDYVGVATNLANLLNKSGRYQESIEVLSSRLKVSSSDKLAHLILGTSFLNNNQFERALEKFQRIIELDKDSLEAQLSISMTLRLANRYQEALTVINQTIKQQPNSGEAYIELGLINMGLADISAANLAFHDAIERGILKVEVIRWQSSFFINEKNYTAAKNLHQSAIDEGIAEPSSYFLLSEILMSESKFKEGENILKQAVKKYNRSSYLFYRLAGYLAALKNYNEAIPYFEKALVLQPNTPYILLNAASNLSKAGKVKESIKLAKQLYDLNNDNLKFTLFYALKLEQDSSSKNEAIRVYKSILERAPNNAIALNNVANLLAEKGDLIAALSYAEKANQYVNNNGQLKDTLGWIYFLQGNYERAEVILNQAAELMPNSGVILFHKGATLAKLNRVTQSKAALEKALTLNLESGNATKIQNLLDTM